MEPSQLNVLIAYDGSDPARRALDRVRDLALSGAVTVVSFAAPVYRDPTLVKFADEGEKDPQRYLSGIVVSRKSPKGC